MLLEQEPECVMVVEIEHVARIGFRQAAMAANDQHVLIIIVRSAEAEIVRSGHHCAMVAERVDHHDLVVNDRETEFREFGLPSAKCVVFINGSGWNGAESR